MAASRTKDSATDSTDVLNLAPTRSEHIGTSERSQCQLYETEPDKDGLPVYDEKGGLGYTQQAVGMSLFSVIPGADNVRVSS